jgi:hypothetical protein
MKSAMTKGATLLKTKGADRVNANTGKDAYFKLTATPGSIPP